MCEFALLQFGAGGLFKYSSLLSVVHFLFCETMPVTAVLSVIILRCVSFVVEVCHLLFAFLYCQFAFYFDNKHTVIKTYSPCNCVSMFIFSGFSKLHLISQRCFYNFFFSFRYSTVLKMDLIILLIFHFNLQAGGGDLEFVFFVEIER